METRMQSHKMLDYFSCLLADNQQLIAVCTGQTSVVPDASRK
jgi:hypothetical protein